MPADFEKYRKYVDRFNLTEAEQEEVIQSVWAMMESVVDCAFGLHPVQQCGDKRKVVHSQDSRGRVNSNHHLMTKSFKSVSGSGGRGKA